MKTVRLKKPSGKSTYPLFLIGIDEAGRGPLAGPLVMGGVLLSANNPEEGQKIFAGIHDSKKLSARQREEWYHKLRSHPPIHLASAVMPVKTIDRINIHQAALWGAERVCQKLLSKIPSNVSRKKISIKLDGGLKLKNVQHQTIIKGDEKIPVIAAASIVAKVKRDQLMLKLHKKYPQYGFARHKGYATLAHREALKKFGPSATHRKSFSCHIVSKIV